MHSQLATRTSLLAWMLTGIACAIPVGVSQAAPPPLPKQQAPSGYRLPEGLHRLWGILSNAPMPQMFSPGETRYNWEWLASRFDADKNGVITRDEIRAADLFDRLDRSRDGQLTRLDFDWSERSPLVQQTLMASQLLNRMDRSSDGRISAEEWNALFAQAAKTKGHLTQEDLQSLLFSTRPAQSRNYSPERQVQRLLAMFRGESSRIFGDAPHVGTMAPDFELKTINEMQQVRLSQFRGQRPVVLVFGSFT